MTGKKPKFRKRTFAAWLVVVATILILYFMNREFLEVDFLRGLVDQNRAVVIPVYLLLLSVLGLTFIPSTPFAIGGVLLFSPPLAYSLNLVGIITSSFIVYHFARFLGLGEALEDRYPDKAAKVQEALRDRELPILVTWSFFPAVPTDLMIYVAASLRIPLWKCLVGVLIGEGILNAVYIFTLGVAL